MSNPAIRSAARTLVQDPSWPVFAPFHETVNYWTDPEDLDELASWTSLKFDVFERSRFCVGETSWRERGAVTFVVMTKVGTGDDASQSVWIQTESLIRGHAWPARMRITDLTPPEEEPDVPGGRWQRADMVMVYEYDTET